MRMIGPHSDFHQKQVVQVTEFPQLLCHAMPKKRTWLCFIKRLFFPDHQQQQQKRSKRKKWSSARLRKNKGLPALPPPPPASPPPLSIQITNLEAEETKSKCVEDVPESISQCQVEEEEPKSLQTISNASDAFPSMKHQHENHVENEAAIKIQASFRGLLARKALRALKGFVRLQAIIRGRAVRRQAMTTLKCLQAIVNIQSEVCTRRSRMVQGKYRGDDLLLQDLKYEKPKIESNGRRRLDDGLLSKDEEIDIILRKKEAILRRQRNKAYSFNHRKSADSEDSKSEGRLKYWLEQYVNDQALKNDDKNGGKPPKLRNIDGFTINPHVVSLPRRSFHNHTKHSSYGEDGLHPSSPTSIPTYMAATESARAKTRSTSSPRVRPMHFDAYSDGDSPYKLKISPMSSINSEVTCLSKFSSKSCCSAQQKSPSLKGVSGPVRSSKNLRDVNLDYESLVVNRGSR